MLNWSLWYYVSEWVVRIVMLFVVTRRRHPASAMSWLLVLFFLPWAGLILYLLIGRNPMRKRRVRRHGRILRRLRLGRERLDGSSARDVESAVSSEVVRTAELAEKLGDMPIIPGNSAGLICESDEAVGRLIEDIDSARNHVHLLFYIFAGDATGNRVVDALLRAVDRGVTCRVLYDAVGSWRYVKDAGKRMEEGGVEVREALAVGLFRCRFARIDLRNHRKLAVIDGRVGYAGSQNIVNADYGYKEGVYHDMMVRVVGPAVLELQTVFAEDWNFETEEELDGENLFPRLEAAGDVSVQALPSGPNYPTETYRRLIVAALYAARESVVITTPYFVPDEGFLEALETAALRGVKAQIIVSRKSDHWLVDAAARSYFDQLIAAGAEVYLFDDGMLHTKSMSVDRTLAFIGSSNFDVRSFELNFEVNLLFYGSGVVDQLRSRQDRYLGGSQRVVPEEWARRSTASRALENIAKLLSPLL